MNGVGFPYQFTAHGRTRAPDADARLRELVEMLLFTIPGERVMRPALGTPVAALLFEGMNDALAAALQSSIHAALQQWLGDVLEVVAVEVDAAGTTLVVDVTFRGLHESEARQIRFKRERP